MRLLTAACLLFAISSTAYASVTAPELQSIDDSSTVSARVALAPAYCQVYVNGSRYTSFKLPRGYYVSQTIWLSDVRTVYKVTFASASLTLQVTDNYADVARATARYPIGINHADIEDYYRVDTVNGLQDIRIRCTN